MVVLHQLVQTVKFHDPQKKFALRVSQYLEVLHSVAALDTKREVSRRRLADPDDESSLVFVEQQFLRVSPRDPAVVPAVRLHLDVVAGDETLLAVQLGPVPVHVVLLVQDLQDLVLPEAQLVVGRGVEVVLSDGLHDGVDTGLGGLSCLLYHSHTVKLIEGNY